MTRWQFLKKHWVMSLIGLVILLTAAAGIIYALATGEGDEGFMKGKDGRTLKWERSSIPLACMYHDSVQDHQHAMDLAREEITSRVGDIVGICVPWVLKDPFPVKPVHGTILLHVGKPPDRRGDGVFVSSPWDPKHGGTTELYAGATGGVTGAIIYVDPDLPRELREKVWLHEMLHAFGLGHDRLKGSIMYPIAKWRSSSLSDRDVERLKEAYVK